ncbi:MAG: GvpL/GvpF family gas vesicle protein [Labilithrix sp.]|nr:GvpL/GvpF family gas vesicle protein [Labilithrix sp.]
MTTPSATYLYCVVKSEAPPKLGRGLARLPSAGPLRALDAADGYHVVVGTVPLSVYSSEAIEAKLRDIDWVGAIASAHEGVVERVGASGTVVPMKLFTIFSSDARAIAHVKKMRKTLDRVVRKIGGCDEWGLRVLFDEARALAAKTKKSAAAKPVSGTGFLLRKKAQDETRRLLTSEAKEEVDDLFDRLSKTSRGALRRPPPNRELAGRVVLDAVFLVPQKGTRRFKSTVASTAKELARDGYHVTLTGPWPAYSFVGGS